jgi:isopenicillin-N epimerase
MNIEQTTTLRDEFLLDPAVIYLNHGSFGATPKPVFESYQHWQRVLESQPCQFFGHMGEHLDQSRAVLAEFLGTDRANLAYVTNATAGINVIVRSLKLQPGDEVLASNHEYGALDRTWRYLANQQGYKYINHPIPLPVTTTESFLDCLWAGVTKNTRVIFISHITSPTGLIFPIAEICKKAREQGILTVIDGAHAPGQIDINLDQLGADFYSGNLHKWLCAPKGTAFIYARPELRNLIQPLIVSWGWDSGKTDVNPLVDYVEMQGTRDISGFLAVPAAIQFFKDHNWIEVRKTCHALLTDTMLRIMDTFQLPPISPLSDQWFSQMACAPIPARVDAGEIHRLLYEQHRIEIPVVDWNGHKMVRISIQGYNTRADTDQLVAALKQYCS